ncbi:MAG TPA: GTP-binding protein [Mycobacteriales bacterium]|nr:GTP-binding protein [Mycobacteriales bacterium]
MPLPLTLLSGPSTSLREQVLRCLLLRRPGLVAVDYGLDPAANGLLVRTVADARGVQHVEQVEPVGCCLSCTVRSDVPEAVRLVTDAERWAEVVLSPPSPIRPGDLAEHLSRHGADVDTVTTVVDARLVLAQLTGDDLLAERGQAAAPTDRRSTAELVVGQLEDADVLLVADLQALDTSSARTVEALLSHLAPIAVQRPLAPGGIGCEDAVTTGRRGRTTSADRARLATLAGALCPPACGVTTVVWQSDRPLHSARLHEVLPDVVADVVRSRGHLWLADRPRHCVRWEQAGGTLAFGDPVRWQQLPGCELVLTGIDLDPAALTARLDACLATDEELADPTWPDPFAGALGPAEDPVH